MQRSNEESKKIHFKNGMFYFKSDQLKRAIQDFDSALALDAKYADAYVGRGLARSQLGDKANARKDIRTALSLVRNDPQILQKMAKLCIKNNCYELAEIVYANLDDLFREKQDAARLAGLATDYNLETNSYHIVLQAGKVALELGKLDEANTFFYRAQIQSKYSQFATTLRDLSLSPHLKASADKTKILKLVSYVGEFNPEVFYYRCVAQTRTGVDNNYTRNCFIQLLDAANTILSVPLGGFAEQLKMVSNWAFEANFNLATIEHIWGVNKARDYIAAALTLNNKSSKARYLNALINPSEAKASLLSVWDNPTARTITKLLCGSLLAKNDPAFLPQFKSFYESNSNFTLGRMHIEDLCMLSIAAKQAGDEVTLRKILNNSNIAGRFLLPLAIPMYLREPFLDVLLSQEAWATPKPPFEEDIHQIKEQFLQALMSSSFGLNDINHINLALQMLCKQTYVGGIMAVVRHYTIPTIVSSKNLAAVASYLEGQSFTSAQLSPATRLALVNLVREDPALLETLQSKPPVPTPYPRLAALIKSIVEDKAEQKNQVRQLREQIAKELRAGFNDTGAINFLNVRYRNDASADVIRAFVDGLVHDYALARTKFDDVVKRTNQTEVLKEYAEFFLEHKSYRLAAYAYSKTELDSDADFINAGTASLQLGRFEQAAIFFNQLGHAGITGLQKNFNLAMISFQSEDMLQALADFEVVLARCKQHKENHSFTKEMQAIEIDTHIQIGLTFLFSKHSSVSPVPFEKALKHFDEAIALTEKPSAKQLLYRALAVRSLYGAEAAKELFISITKNSNFRSSPEDLEIVAHAANLAGIKLEDQKEILRELGTKRFSTESSCIIMLIEAAQLAPTKFQEQFVLSAVAPNILLPYEIPVYLRADYFKVLLSEVKVRATDFQPNLPVHEKKITDTKLLKEIKSEYVDYIITSQDKDIQPYPKLDMKITDVALLREIKHQYIDIFTKNHDMNIAVQALCEHTLLGQVFSISHDPTTFTLNYKSKINMATKLNEFLFNKEPFDISATTLKALEKQIASDPRFLKFVVQHYPALYSAILTTLKESNNNLFDQVIKAHGSVPLTSFFRPAPAGLSANLDTALDIPSSSPRLGLKGDDDL